jgi:hypothetical protein
MVTGRRTILVKSESAARVAKNEASMRRESLLMEKKMKQETLE